MIASEPDEYRLAVDKQPDLPHYKPMPTNLELLTMPLLLASAITDAERTLSVTHRDHRAPIEAELADLRVRWDAEAPARALRAEMERRGFVRSDYDYAGFPAWQCWRRLNRITRRWDRYTPAQALEAAGLADAP